MPRPFQGLRGWPEGGAGRTIDSAHGAGCLIAIRSIRGGAAEARSASAWPAASQMPSKRRRMAVHGLIAVPRNGAGRGSPRRPQRRCRGRGTTCSTWARGRRHQRRVRTTGRQSASGAPPCARRGARRVRQAADLVCRLKQPPAHGALADAHSRFQAHGRKSRDTDCRSSDWPIAAVRRQARPPVSICVR
jgi:hypothetical protein